MRRSYLHISLRSFCVAAATLDSDSHENIRFPTSAEVVRHLMRAITRWLWLVAIASGCYANKAARPPGDPGDQYLIFAAELEGTKQTNVYDAVRQVRPFWFNRQVGVRTGEVTIQAYLDGQQIGTASALRRIPTHLAQRVRFLTPTEAQGRFGSINGMSAAIVVDSSKP